MITNTIDRPEYTLDFIKDSNSIGVDVTFKQSIGFFSSIKKRLAYLFTGKLSHSMKSFREEDSIVVMQHLAGDAYEEHFKKELLAALDKAIVEKKHYHKEDIAAVVANELILESAVYTSEDMYRIIQGFIDYSKSSIKARLVQIANTSLTTKDGKLVFFKVEKIKGKNFYSLHEDEEH